jgi:ABC-type multidrug transport system fused ATPase/permease subunit
MKKWILTIWKDPVWSKVISALIIGAVIALWGWLSERGLKTITYPLPLWLFLLFVVVAMFVVYLVQINKNKEISRLFDLLSRKDESLTHTVKENMQLIAELDEIKKEYNSIITYNHNHLDIDKRLFVRIIDELLPDNGSIAYFDYGGAHTYDNDKLKEFYNFLEKCRNKTFYFHDDNTNRLMQNLISEIRSFVYIVGNSTWAVNNSEMWAVPAEWKYKDPERFDATIDKLNNAVSQLVEAYSNFIVYGRKKFAV